MSNLFEPDRLEDRVAVSYTASELYLESGGSFSISDIAEKLETTDEEILELFPDATSALQFFFTGSLVRYSIMINDIDGFEDFSIDEKLSNLIFTVFDILSENKEFTVKAFGPLIKHGKGGSDFEMGAKQLSKRFIDGDQRIGTVSRIALLDITYTYLVQEFIDIIDFWISDTSENSQTTLAFVDKKTTFFSAPVYNQAADTGIEEVLHTVSSFYMNQVHCLALIKKLT